MLITTCCPVCGSSKLSKTPAVVMPFISYRIFGWKPLVISDESGMRSLENGSSYQLCATTYCEECTLVFCDVRFDDGEMGRLYKDYREEEYVTQRQMFEPDYGRTNDYLMQPIHYLTAISEYLESRTEGVSTVLDWGGDEGTNTPLIGTGRSINIFDISGKNSGQMQNGVTIIDTLVEGKNAYDLIIAMHVFEHLSNPAEELVRLRSFLNPGGYVYIEVPLEGLVDFEMTTAKQASQKIHWHEHINFYSKSSMRALFNAAALETVDVSMLDASDEFRQFKIIQALARLA